MSWLWSGFGGVPCCHYLGHGDKGAFGVDFSYARASHKSWVPAEVQKPVPTPHPRPCLGPNLALELLGSQTQSPAFNAASPTGAGRRSRKGVWAHWRRPWELEW